MSAISGAATGVAWTFVVCIGLVLAFSLAIVRTTGRASDLRYVTELVRALGDWFRRR